MSGKQGSNIIVLKRSSLITTDGRDLFTTADLAAQNRKARRRARSEAAMRVFARGGRFAKLIRS